MPLQGTFDILDFTEAMRLLGRLNVTGRLHVRSRSITANIFFEEGSVVGADQSEHQPAAAAGDVRSRLEEVCFELLEADRGTFEFQAGKPTSLPGAVRLKVDTVLARARTRLDEWRALTERIPSLDVHPRVVTDLDATEVTLDKEKWRMLTAIDGRRNLRAIGRTLNLSDFEACRLLVDLIDAGVADLDDAAKAAAGNRDLVPTIPVPEALAETVIEAEEGNIESVTVTRARVTPASPDRARPSDEAKRATTRPTTVGSGPAPTLPAPAGSPATPAETESAVEPGDEQPATAGAESAEDQGRRRRRARRRTPGGGTAPEPPEPARADDIPSEGGEAAGADAAPSEEADRPGEPEPEGRRPRRVIRIRSRNEPRAQERRPESGR